MLSRWLTAVLLAVLATSCGTTFRTTWRAPDAAPIEFTGKKIAAIFISSEESTRRASEDALARELTSRGAQGVAAYTVVSIEQLKDQTAARERLREAGCAMALVMRVTAREQQVMSYPSAYAGARYGTFSGYSGWGWSMAYDPSYVRTDTVLTIETLAYDLDDDKLLWAGTSEIYEPSDIEARVVELATAAADEMKKEGLIR